MTVKAETLVDIHMVLLPGGQRAPRVPEDTAAVDLEMKVKGELLEDAEIGSIVRIRTAAGRIMEGTLTAVNPEYSHGFGAPIPELGHIGPQLRERLAQLRKEEK